MSDFLRAHPKTPFQMDVLNALSHYSRSPLCRELADKLSTILTALEAILSADKPMPQEIGERMAMLSGQSVAERKAAVQSLIEAYRMRGAFVRNRLEGVDEARLEAFMMNAWVFFINLVGVHSEEKTLEAWLKRLDNWKLCGGLPEGEDTAEVAP